MISVYVLCNAPRNESLLLSKEPFVLLAHVVQKFIFSYDLQEEAAELEEILAKRQKRGKQVDDKPLEEKTVLHSKDNINVMIYDYLNLLSTFIHQSKLS